MTDAQKIKQLQTIINYAHIRLHEAGLYSNSLQLVIALKDTLEDKPISNGLEQIVKAYVNSDLKSDA